MKKIYLTIRNFFSFERNPCQIMKGLKIKSVPVRYSQAIVEGIERKAQVKIWNVAVNTVHPELTCRTHAEWMIEIQFTHANVHQFIGDLERVEVLSGIRSYANNVPLRSPMAMKNN